MGQQPGFFGLPGKTAATRQMYFLVFKTAEDNFYTKPFYPGKNILLLCKINRYRINHIN